MRSRPRSATTRYAKDWRKPSEKGIEGTIAFKVCGVKVLISGCQMLQMCVDSDDRPKKRLTMTLPGAKTSLNMLYEDQQQSSLLSKSSSRPR